MRISKNKIFIPTKDTDEFCIDDKCTLLGWLQKLYLYPEDDEGYVPVNSAKHRKNYNKSISVLRKLAGLTSNKDLSTWEESLTLKKSHELLNKVIKEMSDV